jgi:hypothetical protein
METEKLECKIAQAQMGRYLGGEGLSPEAIDQLEAHVRDCEDCKQALRARRKSLEAILALPASEEFPALEVTHPKVKPAGMPWVDAIRRASAPVPEEEIAEPKKTKPSWRLPIYSAGLAAVIIAMSTVAKDPTTLFGDRAMTTNRAKSKSAPIAGNAAPMKSVTTSGGSAITIKTPTLKLSEFAPAFIVKPIQQFDPDNTPVALANSILEYEMEKPPKQPATHRARRKNVVRVYAPE